MESFRELLEHNVTFKWNETLCQLFNVNFSITNAFDTKQQMCLQTEWSKSGIRYLLLLKYCNCSDKNTSACCSEGWKLVFAGSKFTTPSESWYSPTEEKALAGAWSLENARMFILGCLEVITTKDHKPLLGIFTNQELSNIPNPHIYVLLKKKTLHYQFKTIYCPGKWQPGADAVFRNPTSPY